MGTDSVDCRHDAVNAQHRCAEDQAYDVQNQRKVIMEVTGKQADGIF